MEELLRQEVRVNIVGAQTIPNAYLEIHGKMGFYTAQWREHGITQYAIGSFPLKSVVDVHGNDIILCIQVPTTCSG